MCEQDNVFITNERAHVIADGFVEVFFFIGSWCGPEFVSGFEVECDKPVVIYQKYATVCGAQFKAGKRVYPSKHGFDALVIACFP
ncbi:hypothetical protein ES703_93823 [subsurface metagenome]